MTALPAGASQQAGYFRRLRDLAWEGVAQIVRPASHSHRGEAARAGARHTFVVACVLACAIVALMYGLDATEITWMPPRGTASLWPLRVVTDFGKDVYVISALAVAMLALLLLAPRVTGTAHATLIGVAARIQYLVVAVTFAVLCGELLKGVVGRGRPFVGGQANAFNFAHFSWAEPYASFPSGHATTSCALAFAVTALWPRLRAAMLVYVAAILLSRLVLLAHHPSDVVGGALVGVVGAMAARYWFAARSVAFRIRADGGIVARQGASAAGIIRALRTALVA